MAVACWWRFWSQNRLSRLSSRKLYLDCHTSRAAGAASWNTPSDVFCSAGSKLYLQCLTSQATHPASWNTLHCTQAKNLFTHMGHILFTFEFFPSDAAFCVAAQTYTFVSVQFCKDIALLRFLSLPVVFLCLYSSCASYLVNLPSCSTQSCTKPVFTSWFQGPCLCSICCLVCCFATPSFAECLYLPQQAPYHAWNRCIVLNKKIHEPSRVCACHFQVTLTLFVFDFWIFAYSVMPLQ